MINQKITLYEEPKSTVVVSHTNTTGQSDEERRKLVKEEAARVAELGLKVGDKIAKKPTKYTQKSEVIEVNEIVSNTLPPNYYTWFMGFPCLIRGKLEGSKSSHQIGYCLEELDVESFLKEEKSENYPIQCVC